MTLFFALANLIGEGWVGAGAPLKIQYRQITWLGLYVVIHI